MKSSERFTRLAVKGIIFGLVVVWVLGGGIYLTSSYALPTLQLDIAGGTYDSQTETIIAPGNPFTLYALLVPNSKNILNDWYFISAAVAPKVGPSDVDLGSFSFDGKTVDVTDDMVYGVPPMETIIALQGKDKGDLRRHGIYDTFFAEFGFQFDKNDQIDKYNTQDRAETGGLIPTSGKGMYYASFTIDTSNLDPDYVIHFDLYNTKIKNGGDIDITEFAPSSHDAESRKVPEPDTLLLLGTGLLGLGLWGRRLRQRL